MKTFITSLLISLLLVGCKPEVEPTPESVINDLSEEYAKHQSIKYDIQYQMKYFDHLDTNLVIGTAEMIRDTNDTLLGGAVWISADDSADRYYDLNYVYFIDHRKDTITRYNAHDNKIYVITGSNVSGLIKVPFLKIEKFKKLIIDTTVTLSLLDTNLNAKEFSKLYAAWDDDEPFYDMWKSYYIEKTNNAMERIEFSAGFQNQTQYNTWKLSNTEFDKVTLELLNKRLEKYKETYVVIDYVEPSREEVKPLENGTKAPHFSGVFYPNDDSVHLSDYAGKVVLIDFWYKSCYPCIQAIPHISAIKDKYAENGLVVLGLNPMDNNEKQRQQFPDFIEINKLDYPIVFIDRSVSKSFKVRGYPTFYVIDKEGNIAYSSVGYGEGTEAVLDSVMVSLF